MLKGLESVFVLTTCCLFAPAPAAAQTGAVIPQGGAGHTHESSCLILKRMGPADQVTSHMYSFGIRGKQFQYVEGKLPEGFPFHGRMTDHDVRNLQGRGSEVLVLEAHYTAEDLKQARDQCKAMTGDNPNKAVETKIVPAAPQPQMAATAVASLAEIAVNVDSIPPGADIEVDGGFVGNTPSTITVAPGTHEITVRKKGFAAWTRKLNVTGGTVHLNAELEQASGN